ncbi:recombinase family protein, partial [Listeria monocytogenes]|nr:recombinase family protein [Listeria monocytogenes]
MKVGYARVSSKTQNLNRQIEKLNSEKVEKIFSEKMQGDQTERPALNEMLEFIREGDIVTVTELDRLARDNKLLTNLIAAIHKKGATLDVLNLPTLKGIEDNNLRLLINNLI